MKKVSSIGKLFGVLVVVCAAQIGTLGALGASVEIDRAYLKFFRPLPAAMESSRNPVTKEKIELGRMLYYDKRLSKNQDISCNSCHELDKYGVDRAAVSTGHRGEKGSRNAPTVYNAADHFAQFWDGRARDVEEQAKGPIMNPVEMAMPDADRVLAVLQSIPAYTRAFRKAFPGEVSPVTLDNAALAIGAFERGLITPARWDRFLKGDNAALSDQEKAGFNEFVQLGCQRCHQGELVGGTMYQKLGLAEPWKATNDLGRYQVTKQDRDKMVFKVPALRNIAETWPYYHDGSVPTLQEAVKLMAHYQLGKDLDQSEVESVVTWLQTLTGELPADYVREPALPKSTAATPRPDPN